MRERLVACVNVLPGMQSVYAWQGAVERANEVVAILKSREGLKDALFAAVKAKHPYDTPILLALPVAEADPARWLGSWPRLAALPLRTGGFRPGGRPAPG